ncbi:MBL fold metallo-hydrolase [Pararhizobium sp. DWP3-4]|uniref:MBL fold metallo-hydrolase n=1 Tax=Pararhizobium sp. DWP3-4 TaxID=2804565 RepID=UPI003CEEA211
MSDNVVIAMLPAQDGDCLFVEACGFRMVIDGGRAETGTNTLPAFLSSLPEREGKPIIDLMVLTHIDADHVAGLLTFLANTGKTSIGEVWFNGLDHHKKAAGICVRKRNASNETAAFLGTAETLSVRQALNFDECITDLRIPWNIKMAGETIMVQREGALPRFNLADGLNLLLLGPTQWKVEDFYPQWLEHVKGLDSEPTLAHKPRITPSLANMQELATQDEAPDRTKPNGASIAFVLEIGAKRILFSADAHPDDIAHGLEREYGAGRIWFEAIKVAHHGSARNNTSSLIEKLQSSCWLISTNGSKHAHPDPQAIARIVLAPEEGKELVFNYRSTINGHWDAEDLKRSFKYSTFYGDGKSPVIVTLFEDGFSVA